MPSLRRSFSSPSVRSSPYPPPVSAASTRTRPHGHRRSSGSETSTRRVLADIEWWRVADGQLDLDAPHGQEDHPQDDAQNHDSVTLADDVNVPDFSAGGGPDLPQTPLMWSLHTFDISRSQEYALPTTQFAALSIAPRSPTRRRHGRDSSFSSLESTPEASETPLEAIRLSVLDSPLAFTHVGVPFAHPPSPLLRPTIRAAPALSSTRSQSFGGFDHFADLGSSFSLDDHLFR
ncbi:hypothetical protein SERLADRAFT_475661 [Serpula lacrymans var. lacrymans S7.9]|uniref:Uncharacterized protein n=1 Tax=Serpula lacrymans var. lacrymans (strain S7.9) TaxID=578457 RepID=F8P6G3_SERL9|nr:uncharacterized protein SERLADRAFT_475661 [Serpula lacrymans var. lacrymans S7.9]EGO21030.1 hypothetical protein SERLADRAFT_475661 [Serpula lacrymans var. lacrymans S7.9]